MIASKSLTIKEVINQIDKIFSLQEDVLDLKKKISTRESKKGEELTALHKQVCRLHENIIDIEKKTDHFSQVNDRKFRQIWEMKTAEANALLEKVKHFRKSIKIIQ